MIQVMGQGRLIQLGLFTAGPLVLGEPKSRTVATELYFVVRAVVGVVEVVGSAYLRNPARQSAKLDVRSIGYQTAPER